MRVKSAILALALLLAPLANAELTLPSVFSNHMVLQQNALIPIWGWAEPGDRIVVRLANQEARTTANGEGRWLLRLQPMNTGGPHALHVRAERNGEVTHATTIEDVLVGEVWLASGQSNMQWPIRLSANPEQEIAAANHPNIRFFQAPRVTAAEPQTNIDGQWHVTTPETAPEFSAVAYHFARELHHELGRPIGIIHASWGGTPAEAWTSLETLQSLEILQPTLQRWEQTLAEYPNARERYEQQLAEYDELRKQAEEQGTTPPRRPNPPQGPDHPHRPASLYNAMIHPFIPCAIRGVIWYQGESNASRAHQYHTLFPALINDWRNAWGGQPLHFHFVQLANFMQPTDDPNQPSPWAELREAQRLALQLPNTAMAVTIDIGEQDDIHPKNKQDVGKRLALPALANIYGQDRPHSGPLYTQMHIKQNEIWLEFDHTYGGLIAKDGPLTGFTIAGPDQQFVWAQARIHQQHVIVHAPQITQPAAVRYNWANNPSGNLYNQANLPASPFRTDTWPLTTQNNH